MKVGDKAEVSIGPASDYLGVTKTIEIVEVFTNTVVVKYEDVGEALRIITKDNWRKLVNKSSN